MGRKATDPENACAVLARSKRKKAPLTERVQSNGLRALDMRSKKTKGKIKARAERDGYFKDGWAA
jgi:hypothetical protein